MELFFEMGAWDYAKHMDNAGVDEVIGLLMGHANIMITYQKYIHVIKEQETKAMVMVKVI